MRRPTRLLVAVAVSALALAACGGDDDGPSDTTPNDPTTPSTPAPGGGEVPAEIAGVQWVFDGYYTVGGLQPLSVTDTGAGLTIEADGTVSIDTGCNQGSATATFADDTLQVGPITVTEKACLDEGVMQIEQMLLGQLEEEQSWNVTDGALSLFASRISDTGMHFHDAANPPSDDTPPTT